jgi:hypothetical protein
MEFMERFSLNWTNLKGQLHEILISLFYQTSPHGSLMHHLKQFQIWLRTREAIRDFEKLYYTVLNHYRPELHKLRSAISMIFNNISLLYHIAAASWNSPILISFLKEYKNLRIYSFNEKHPAVLYSVIHDSALYYTAISCVYIGKSFKNFEGYL